MDELKGGFEEKKTVTVVAVMDPARRRDFYERAMIAAMGALITRNGGEWDPGYIARVANDHAQAALKILDAGIE